MCYQSSPSRSQTEFSTILWMRRYFEKNMEGPKTLTLSKKNQFEKKKNRGSSRFEGSGLQLGMIPFLFDPQEITFYVRYFRPMFVSGN